MRHLGTPWTWLGSQLENSQLGVKETPLQVAPGSADCQISATLPNPAAAACHYSTQGIPTNDNAHQLYD